jgi:hypothetical protein
MAYIRNGVPGFYFDSLFCSTSRILTHPSESAHFDSIGSVPLNGQELRVFAASFIATNSQPGIRRPERYHTDPDTLAGIFMPGSLHTRNNADPQHNQRNRNDVMLGNMHQVSEIGHTRNQNQIANRINSKGHNLSPGKNFRGLPPKMHDPGSLEK